VTDPFDILIGVIWYTDTAATGHFADLGITPVKFTLDCFHRKAREKPYLWRTLGYLPKVKKSKSRGRRLFVDSGHVERGPRKRGHDTKAQGGPS